jgi:NADH dehydrogenase (ubiquinone) Fe-S protein 2
MPYFDRLDYVSTLSQESVYTNAIDKLFGVKHNTYNSLIRTVFDELTRILNHLLAISCHALDVGSMTSVL